MRIRKSWGETCKLQHSPNMQGETAKTTRRHAQQTPLHRRFDNWTNSQSLLSIGSSTLYNSWCEHANRKGAHDDMKINSKSWEPTLRQRPATSRDRPWQPQVQVVDRRKTQRKQMQGSTAVEKLRYRIRNFIGQEASDAMQQNDGRIAQKPS